MYRIENDDAKQPLGRTSGSRFTLIELLVVVATIGILAAMLLPMLSRAKRKAVRVVDLNNRRQSTLAMLMYTNDYSAWYPLHTSDGRYAPNVVRNGSSGPRIVDQLDDYIGDFSVWQCLGLPDAPLIDDPINTRDKTYSNIQYYANRQNPDFLLGEPTPNKVTHKNSTASMPLLSCNVRDHTAKGMGLWVGHAYDGNLTILSMNPSYTWYTAWSMKQVEGACIAFMDGHVSWVPGNELEMVGTDHTGASWVKAWAVLPDGD